MAILSGGSPVEPEKPVGLRMGAAGAAWVHASLTWDLIAERLRNLLHERLQEPSRSMKVV